MNIDNKYIKKIDFIKKKVQEHNLLAQKTISLVASGNIVSPFVHELMNTDLLYRAAEGKKNESHFPGLKSFYDIEEVSQKEIAKIFNADFADLRPISGTLANIIVYTACSKINDYICAPSISSGSHVSQAGNFLIKMRGYKYIFIKTLFNSYAINLNDCQKLLKKYEPALLLLGGSVCIEWQDLENIIDIAHQSNTIVVFDASHIAGLIATKAFPNPLDYGVDLMTMTTCKTIPGPSHSWILGKMKYKNIIEKLIFPGFISGGHLHEYIGALVSLYEIKKYKGLYGERIIECSNLLAEELTKSGFKFLKTLNNEFTETHQIISYHHNKYTPKEVEEKLAKINILVNINYLPPNSSYGEYGVRWGTQEFVRIGGDKNATKSLAKIIANYLSKKHPNISFYQEEVLNLKMSIQENALY